MAVDFEVIEHTADVGLIARGRELPEVFVSAACGLFSLIADLEEVGEKESYRVEVTAEDEEGLAVQWLNELIYLFDVDNLLFKGFDIQEFAPTRLVAEARGEKIDPSRHHIKLGVKAATYHMLKVEREGEGYRLQVLFDI